MEYFHFSVLGFKKTSKNCCLSYFIFVTFFEQSNNLTNKRMNLEECKMKDGKILSFKKHTKWNVYNKMTIFW